MAAVDIEVREHGGESAETEQPVVTRWMIWRRRLPVLLPAAAIAAVAFDARPIDAVISTSSGKPAPSPMGARTKTYASTTNSASAATANEPAGASNSQWLDIRRHPRSR
jgi:hypothetical protein